MWSYDKPTKAGTYYVNLGDVVTETSLSVVKLRSVTGVGELRDENLDRVSQYHHSCKFMPVDYEYLNTIGNKE